jgi:hypothetical protein
VNLIRGRAIHDARFSHHTNQPANRWYRQGVRGSGHLGTALSPLRRPTARNQGSGAVLVLLNANRQRQATTGSFPGRSKSA